MITRETIYKRTSSGSVQIWYGQLEGNKYRTVAGKQDGKEIVSEWTICYPKNVGRSNETTGEQQAALELESKYENKLKREYRRDIGKIDVKHYTKPMKANRWFKDIKKRPKPGTKLGLQPKYDGMRGLSELGAIKSQDGIIIPGAPHITEGLTKLFTDFPTLKIDGELYNHAYKKDFEKLMSALKKAPDTPELLARAKSVVQYYIYDIVGDANYLNQDGTGRHPDLQMIFDEYLSEYGDMFQLVETEWVVMDEDGTVVEEHLMRCLEDGYEGSMVRWCEDGGYLEKRSNFMMKVKPMEDDEFEIVDIQEAKGNWAGYAKRVIVRLKDGQLCEAGIKGDKPYCKDLLENKDKYIGKMGTVTYLRYTADGKLNLPVFKGVRWDI